MASQCETPDYDEGPCHCDFCDPGRLREDRVETIYQSWGAREMAERIVELEDELGADVDGICTGMHADVAEAHSEIERLTGVAARYRSAWLSARQRAADEANMGQEAVDHIRQDRDRWRAGHETAEAQLVAERREVARLRAERDEVRETTPATSDDVTVWQTVGRVTSIR
ncbi:hypothetical protein [Streptomyces sp. NPDC004528]|uniref:hypothetical protein n=1 Tax=Streptomyces sp. NPDC004528 TaxID=3154550 RepID=UPI0033AFD3EE